jgi:hypothetical protein
MTRKTFNKCRIDQSCIGHNRVWDRCNVWTTTRCVSLILSVNVPALQVRMGFRTGILPIHSRRTLKYSTVLQNEVLVLLDLVFGQCELTLSTYQIVSRSTSAIRWLNRENTSRWYNTVKLKHMRKKWISAQIYARGVPTLASRRLWQTHDSDDSDDSDGKHKRDFWNCPGTVADGGEARVINIDMLTSWDTYAYVFSVDTPLGYSMHDCVIPCIF